VSIVRTLVAMLEPQRGVVFDPCCGSGGMFVQSDLFTGHSRELAFHGQESKEFTYRLCRMNLFIHGLDGHVELGNSYTDDKHAGLQADYVLANPPFNDGAKSDDGWGAHQIAADDARLRLGNERMTLSKRNANTMWMLHFLHHLAPGGSAGFVMATGELSNQETARLAVRKALVEGGHVDCIVQLSGQLFATTQIPCSLWFLSKARGGEGGPRERRGEVLFIDGRSLGSLIPGSRKQKELSAEEIERMAAVYRQFKRDRTPEAVRGFCQVVSIREVSEHGWSLTPGRYVGTPQCRSLCRSRATGTTNLGLERADFLGLPAPEPTREQLCLVELLDSLDDKIELNLQMNRTLEQIAQALFRSWFVDFDPVVAKADGRKPFGMNDDMAALFPNHFTESNVGPIPNGWSWQAVSDCLEVNPSRALAKGADAPYLPMQDAPTDGAVPREWSRRPFGSGVTFRNGDALVAKITPCLENGKGAFINDLGPGEVGWGSTAFFVLCSKPPLPPEHAYLLTRLDDFRARTWLRTCRVLLADSVSPLRPSITTSVPSAHGRCTTSSAFT
jgi:hypothetical protein